MYLYEWMNNSTDNFSNQAVVDFKIQSSHTEKAPKNYRQPCTEWFSSLCLQTNRKHMEKQSLICTRKTSFYTDNITSTLMIVVFSINWSRMFALYVHQMCCKLELKTLNNQKTTASLQIHRKRRMCSDPCICTTQRYSGFFSEVLRLWLVVIGDRVMFTEKSISTGVIIHKLQAWFLFTKHVYAENQVGIVNWIGTCWLGHKVILADLAISYTVLYWILIKT